MYPPASCRDARREFSRGGKHRIPADDPAAPESTVKKIEAELARTTPEGWKDASLAYYTVPALSDVRRMPHAYPADGKAQQK